MSSIIAELVEDGPGPTANGWLMLVGDRLANAAVAAAGDNLGDVEITNNADELAALWRFLRGQDDG